MSDMVHELYPKFWAIKGNESIKRRVQPETKFFTLSFKASFSCSADRPPERMKQPTGRVLMKHDVVEFHYDLFISSNFV
jgi:hypothetical protein